MQIYFFRKAYSALLLFSPFFTNYAQTIRIEGSVSNEVTDEPIPKVSVLLEGSDIVTHTDENGTFSLQVSKLLGAHILNFSDVDFESVRVPVELSDVGLLAIGSIQLHPNISTASDAIMQITLTNDTLDEEFETTSNNAGLLSASKDVFLKAAAFDWSSTFFRPRGYDGAHSRILLNGLEMNKLLSGRPQWSNWGGLNDVLRNQEFSEGISAADQTFGGIGGTTAVVLEAGSYRQGARVSYGASNRSYQNRIMGTYHSGLSKSGWAYSVSLSKRFGEQGFFDGTVYDANAFFTSVEKRLGDRHSFTLTGIYTPITRGKSAPNTQEVWDLKGRNYNPYWGFQNGAIRNSRTRRIEEPIAILQHKWKWNQNFGLQTSFGFQTGQIANSRLSYTGSTLQRINNQTLFIGNGSNPDPSYYQNLPSYQLRNIGNEDYASAFLADQNFRTNGQLDWNTLYAANSLNNRQDKSATYVLYDDRTDDTQLSAASIFRGMISTHSTLNIALRIQQLQSRNFATITDQLGGRNYLDIDAFEEGTKAQNDLQNPNRYVVKDDKFQYHYTMNAQVRKAFLQWQFSYSRIKFFVAGNSSYTKYQREGFYENGNAPGSGSLGKSEEISFTDFGTKGGFTFQLIPKHFLTSHATYRTKAPLLRNTFENPRQNNRITNNLASEKILSADIGYRLQTSKIKMRLNGYITRISNATNVSFYFTDALAGLGINNTAAFVQEIMTGLETERTGLEFGISIPLHPTFKLKGAAAIGQYVYSTNPSVYLAANTFDEPLSLGVSNLKNYHLSNGPQQAYNFGFEYNDPHYWWLSTSLNYLSNAFINVSPISRTQNFYTDTDGLPLLNYDTKTAKSLLRQEQFDPYFLLNVVGGKSWRLKKFYLGFFAGINNVLNTRYKTGGFEQARNANYTGLLEEDKRAIPIFGNKYWLGTGTTYFTNFYIRF